MPNGFAELAEINIVSEQFRKKFGDVRISNGGRLLLSLEHATNAELLAKLVRK